MRFYNYLLNTLTLISLAVSARPRSRSGSLNISDSENGSDLDQFALEGRASTDMSSSSSSTISPLIELPPPTHKLIDGGVETRGFPESLIQSTPPTSTPSITPIDTKAAAVSLLAKHFQLALSTGNILEMEQIFTSASPTTQRLFITTEIPVIMSRQTFAQQTEMVFLFAKFSGEEVSPLLTAMLERSPELVRAKDRSGRTLMHTAATFGRIGLIKFLLSSTTPDGPSLLLEKDKTNGNLPICDAVIRGDTRLVNYLLTQDTRAKNVYSDGNILAHFRNKFKESLIHMASELGNPVILSMVLEEFALSGALGRDQVKAIINSKTMMGETCLHLAAIAVAGAGLGASNNDSEFSPVSCLAMLVNRGGDLSIRNADGETPAQISGIKV